VNALLDAYRAQFRATISTQLQYRASLGIWLIGMVLQPVVFLVVWATVARTNGGSVGGYSARDFAAYFLVMMLVEHTTFTWIMYEFDNRVRQGSFSPRLLRPIHPIHSDVADNLTYKGLTLVVLLPIAGLLALAFHPRIHTTPWAVAAFFPAVALAAAMRFMIEWMLALAAFWLQRVSALNQAYMEVVFFCSGQVAPLSLFPRGFQVAASLLPFRWMVAFPTELVLGRLSPTEAAKGIGIQIAWLVVALLALSTVWRAGVRRYSAVGS
jgi:ABC-2 type transport system permease protein